MAGGNSPSHHLNRIPPETPFRDNGYFIPASGPGVHTRADRLPRTKEGRKEGSKLSDKQLDQDSTKNSLSLDP